MVSSPAPRPNCVTSIPRPRDSKAVFGLGGSGSVIPYLDCKSSSAFSGVKSSVGSVDSERLIPYLDCKSSSASSADISPNNSRGVAIYINLLVALYFLNN